MKASTIKNLLISFAVITCLFFAFEANATPEPSMYLSPSTGLHAVGDEFTVDIVLDTGEKAINAAEAVLVFDTDKLEVIETSIEESIFSSWIIAPTFDNKTGRIEFAGNSSSSYNGMEGKVATVRFKAINESTTSVRFRSGAILAADGKGTNILSKLISGVYTITGEIIEVVPEPEYVAPYNAPGAVTITSLTHPDQNEWYTGNNVELRWIVPSGTIATRTSMDHKPYSIPSVTFYEALTEKTYQNLDDGVWYFHLQLRNRSGWGEVSTYRVQIDSSKPEHFRISELKRDDLSNPKPRFIVDAFDAESGIKKYEVNVDNKNITWIEKGNQIHELGPFSPGSYTAIVKAVDAAENYIVDSVVFEIESLTPPIFYEYPDVLHSGAPLVLKGLAYPNTSVKIWLEKSGGEPQQFEVDTDDTGAFSFVPYKEPEDGVYKIWATVLDHRGAESEPSKKIGIAVRPPGVLMAAMYTLDTISIFVPIMAVLFLIGSMSMYFRHRYITLRQALNKEVKEAEMVVHESFLTLKKEAMRNVKMLEKIKKSRGLTKEEMAVMNGLKGHLSKIEKTIEKEIHDIERTLDARHHTQEKEEDNFWQSLKGFKVGKKTAK
ncbi:MAG: cohesin domain-containing protein [Candidatus Spechtbacterales bacterium]|nr:cohesin domain-containing protein [Candidatus Spechtbacterales bacterium]